MEVFCVLNKECPLLEVPLYYNTIRLTFTDLHREISSTLPTFVGVRGYEDADDVTPFSRARATTRERRAHTVNLLPQMGPDYKFIEKYKIVSVSGKQFGIVLPSAISHAHTT